MDKRDYHPDPETTKSVFKETKYGEVIIDLANRGDDIFEGKQKKFHLNIIDGNIEIKDLEGQRVPVPSRSVLLTMKIKAAWDRSWRVRKNKGDRIDWDRSKMIKDHADILALLEPGKHEDELNFTLLGDFFKEYPFLERVLDEIVNSRPAHEKYGIQTEEAKKIMERFRSLIIS